MTSPLSMSLPGTLPTNQCQNSASVLFLRLLMSRLERMTVYMAPPWRGHFRLGVNLRFDFDVRDIQRTKKIVVFVVENYCVSSFEGESRKTLTSNNSMLLIYKVV